MRLDDLNGKLVILLGFGREGKAMYEVLRARKTIGGALMPRIIVTDEQRIDVPEYHALADAIAAVTSETIVIKSPGIPWHRSYVEEMQTAGAQFTSSTNIFMAERIAKTRTHHGAGECGFVIGVTGTKGKSTTSALLSQVLRNAGKPVVLAGNIGVPAITHVDDATETYFVLEMSSYQLADLVVAPHIAVILNLYEEHMDYHGDVAQYHAAKMRIAERQTADDFFVYNDAFPQLVDLAKRVKSKTIPFASRDDRSLDTLNLLGQHNRENAAGVLAVTDILEIERRIVEDTFRTFVALPHRLQDVGVVGGIQFVNDSFCTTPAAAIAAIDVFQDRLGAIILGGHDRGYDFTALAQRVVALGVRIYLLQNATRLERAIRAVGGEPVMLHTFPEIIPDVLSRCAPGSVCLLSPASPSFGQFHDFVERGEQFIAAVHTVESSNAEQGKAKFTPN